MMADNKHNSWDRKLTLSKTKDVPKWGKDINHTFRWLHAFMNTITGPTAQIYFRVYWTHLECQTNIVQEQGGVISIIFNGLIHLGN